MHFHYPNHAKRHKRFGGAFVWWDLLAELSNKLPENIDAVKSVILSNSLMISSTSKTWDMSDIL